MFEKLAEAIKRRPIIGWGSICFRYGGRVRVGTFSRICHRAAGEDSHTVQQQESRHYRYRIT